MKINTNEININSKILILTLKLTLMEINCIYKFKRTKLCWWEYIQRSTKSSSKSNLKKEKSYFLEEKLTDNTTNHRKKIGEL